MNEQISIADASAILFKAIRNDVAEGYMSEDDAEDLIQKITDDLVDGLPQGW
jgi:hypothetical protein